MNPLAQAVDHVHHFHMGGWILGLAFLTSVVGSTAGLGCTMQSRYPAAPRVRILWLVLAAISIGGVGIWVMHFIAMLGFTTPGFPVRYDVTRTVLSAALSVSAVFAGLLVFGVRTNFTPLRLALGGLITGVAVNLMHYTGMWAVRIKGEIEYNPGLVLLSVVIAIGAATAALWFTVAVDRLSLRILAGLVMGVAVTGMHYTGMAAVRVRIDPAAPDPGGVEVFSFLFPVFVIAVFALAVPICAALMASSPAEKEAELRVAEDPTGHPTSELAAR